MALRAPGRAYEAETYLSMNRISRRLILGGVFVPWIFSSAGCGSSEVGAIKEGADGAEALKSKTEGRFKETIPSSPAARKPAKGKRDTADEGKETR
jgi:hypothetical protein